MSAYLTVRSVEYECHGPFFERPDLWWPVYVEDVCFLNNDIFRGKTKLEVAATPLVEPLPAPLFEPVLTVSLGSFTVPREDNTPVWEKPHHPWTGTGTWTGTTTSPDPVPAIFLPASGIALVTALMALVMMKQTSLWRLQRDAF